jgi:D-alanyl-D-alanine dipeptidase
MSSSPFAGLAPLFDRPVPDQAPRLAALQGYRATPIDRADPAYGEPLVDVSAAAGIAADCWYAPDRNPPSYAVMPGSTPVAWLRRGVAERLAAIDARVGEAGLELVVFDGWRSRQLQAHMHDVWVPAALRQRFPAMSEAEIAERVGLYWAAPTVDPDRPAPHATGAAVDLTLRWRDSRQPLWMGCLFDEASELAAPDHFERDQEAGVAFSHEEARRNRRLLHAVMAEAGFSCHPGEWWHYSFGDQMWARLTGAPTAIYGLAEPPAG